MKGPSLALALACLWMASITAQEYVPSEENLANRAWFQDAKFGLFVHWGVYSVLGKHEWVMETDKIDKVTYERVADFFNPVDFDADEWVLMAKNAGMRYITITSKHHDGFAMYDSQVSDWDIIDRTHYKKDVLSQLAEACRKHGLKLFFYYSQLDWHSDDYYPRGSTGHTAGRPDSGDFSAYIDYMNAQLTELLTNYGEIGGIWFDGWWDNKEAEWRLQETYDLIHSIQPGAMIGSNHHQAPKPGEDFQMFEKDLPGENTSGFSSDAEIGRLPLETAETMAQRWGFSLTDKDFKTTRQLVHYLVKAAGHNANFLLNVGPMPNGKIQPEYIDTLARVGEWMKRNGESIYGTRGGPVAPQVWGVTTQKDNRVFVHILDWDDGSFLLPDIPGQIDAVRSFPEGMALEFQQTDLGTVISLPEHNTGTMYRILEVRVTP